MKSPYNGYFKILDCPEKCYWFGFIVADGSIGIYKGPQFRFSLGLKEEDTYILKVLARTLGYSDSYVKIKKDKPYSCFSINSKELFNDLINNGLVPNKARKLTKAVIPDNYVSHFIRGLFDGDGTIHKRCKGSNPYLTCGIYGNKYLLDFISDNIVTLKGKFMDTRSGTYRITGSYSYAVNFCNYIYKNATIFLNRKRNIYEDYLLEKETYLKEKQSQRKEYDIENNLFKKENGRYYKSLNCTVCGENFCCRADQHKECCSRKCTMILKKRVKLCR